MILIVGFAANRGTILGAFAAAAFVGYMLGRNRRQYLGIASEATLAATDRERQATLAERDRIARELHDVLGHSLTGVSLQIESAAAALESAADTDRALTHLEQAGKLVRTGQQEAAAAVRTLQDSEFAVHTGIQQLVAMRRADGAPASCAVTGTPRPLNAATTLALYRVTQEALTNAAKHAPGEPVEVRLTYEQDAVTVRVVNRIGASPRGAVSSGLGIPGMRERVAAVGGTLEAGRVDGRWQVVARVRP